MAEASLDDWERTVSRFGRAARDRPAGALLGDLTADLADLKQALRNHRSASALRRRTRVAAQMSGLMCLTLGAYELINAAPKAQRALPAALQLRELLLTTEKDQRGS